MFLILSKEYYRKNTIYLDINRVQLDTHKRFLYTNSLHVPKECIPF